MTTLRTRAALAAATRPALLGCMATGSHSGGGQGRRREAIAGRRAHAPGLGLSGLAPTIGSEGGLDGVRQGEVVPSGVAEPTGLDALLAGNGLHRREAVTQAARVLGPAPRKGDG